MEMKTNFRPSKVPGFCQCPGYILEADREYEILGSKKDMEFANLGSAVHEIFKDFIIQNKATNIQNLTPYCEKWGVPYNGYMGVGRKVSICEQKWAKNMANFFTHPISEEEIRYQMPDGTWNGGTPDLYQLHGDFALVLDLKTGETDLDYMPQVKDYALILYRNYEEQGLNTIYGYVWNPVIESYVGEEFTAEALEEYEAFLINQIGKVGKEFRPGPWCGYCNNLEVCPAHRKAFLQMEDKVKHITVEQIREVRPIIAAMKKVCDVYDTTEKALLTKYGVIDLGDGHELAYRQECRKGFDVPKTISILRNTFGVVNDLIAPHLSIKKTAIEGIAKAIAPPRGKGKTVKAVFEALDEGEAVKEKYIQKRCVRRISQTKEVTDGGEHTAS